MHEAVLRIVVTLALLLACAGCGTSKAQSIGADGNAAELQLSLLPESLVGGAKLASSRLDFRRTSDGIEVLIGVEDAQELKAFYFQLRYDARQLTPSSAKATNLLGSADSVLEMARFDQPGVVDYGQILCNWDQRPGYTGSGCVVVVRFKGLKGEFASLARSICLAPSSDASRTVLSLDTDSSTLSWRYYSQGDYDQNGIVGITDLTPLGLHFGELGPFDINSSLAVIDGNSNGAIGLSDLVPIGANFGRRVRGYRIYQSLDSGDFPANNAAASTIAWIDEVHEAVGNPVIERISYSFILPALVDSAFYWVRPYDGEVLDPGASEGTPSNMLDVAAMLNEAPVADLICHPALGLAPLPVQFYAGGSADPDGTIVQYDWDFDGDGTYDQTTFQAFATHIYDTPGTYIASVRVTDNLGATAVDGNLVVANQGVGWRLGLVVRDTPLDNMFAAVNVDGKLAVAFSSYNEIRYCSATDAAASTWAIPTAIATNPVREGSLSLAELGGRPAVVYAEDSAQGPFFVHAADAAGAAWPAPHAIALPNLPDIFQTRIIISGNGRPLVAASTIGAGAHSLQVMLATDNTGLLWAAPSMADGGAAGFLTPQLTLVNMLPAMAYTNAAGAAVYSLSSGIPDGSDWVDETVIDDMIFSGLSLAEVNGRPAVAYINNPTSLIYIRADDAVGSSWLNIAEPDPGTSLRFDTALANNAGVPVIAYVAVAAGGTDDELRFVRGMNEDGGAWEAPQIIGVFDRVGQLQLLELGDGRPALLFQVLFDVLDPGLNGDALYCAIPE